MWHKDYFTASIALSNPEFLSQTGVTALFEFNDPRDSPEARSGQISCSDNG